MILFTVPSYATGMRKLAAFFAMALTLPLHGCAYTYSIWATMVDGRLAFETGDASHDCFTNIRVAAAGPLEADPALEDIVDPVARGNAIDRARAVWMTDAGATYACEGHFPVAYGAPMPGITVVPARPLSVGVPYSVSTYGPRGAGGDGCFRINPDGRPENLPDQECSFEPPAPAQAAAAAPPAAIAAPARPRRDLASLATPEDYPASALRNGEEGRVRIALDVGADGRATDCTILSSSGSSALDAVTCRVLRSRARFTPARDTRGNPTASRVEQEISWTLPAGASAGSGVAREAPPNRVGGMITHSSSAQPVVVTGPPVVHRPVNALPPPEQTGPSQMYALTPYRGIERYLRDYPSLAACEQARTQMTSEEAARRLCGFGPRRPPF